MSSSVTGSYGNYAPVSGHPLVRIEACGTADGTVHARYIADPEPLLALGFVPEDLLTSPRPRRTGKGSKPRAGRRITVDAYWRSADGLPVRRFRVLVQTALADALTLPGVREALAAHEQREDAMLLPEEPAAFDRAVVDEVNRALERVRRSRRG